MSIEQNFINRRLKDNISTLINSSRIDEAKALIAEYQNIMPDDIEIYSMNAIIAILESRLDDAELILLHGLEKDIINFDILYNLGYVYQIKNEILKAIINYRKAYFYCENDETKENIKKVIYDLEYSDLSESDKYNAIEYKKQVKNYAKAQMLNPNIKINISDYIIAKPIKANVKPKILYGTIEIANLMHLYSSELKKKGYEAISLTYYPNYLGYKTDLVLDIRKLESYEEIRNKTIDIAAEMISEFDVFHFLFNTSFLLDNSDLHVLKALGKKVIMQHAGSDVRTYFKAVNINKFYELIKDTYFKGRDEDLILKKLKNISKYVSCSVVDHELYEYVRGYYKYNYNLRLPIDLKEYSVSKEHLLNKRPLIVHAPTNPAVKGTKYILKAIEDLKIKYDFDFILVQNMKHEEAKKIYRKADIVIDQVIYGWGGLALECMAMGKTVISYMNDYAKDKYPKELPIVSASPYEIREKIEMLLNNSTLRETLGEQGRKYVEKYHDVSILVQGFIDNLYECKNFSSNNEDVFITEKNCIKLNKKNLSVLENSENIQELIIMNDIKDAYMGKINVNELLVDLKRKKLLKDKYLRELVVNMYPVQVIIETIRGCQLRCPICGLQWDENTKERGVMSDEIYDKVIKELVEIKSLKLYILHFMGEPFLDKNITDRIKKIRKKTNADILIDSNLSVEIDPFAIVKSGLSILEVAFDGGTQESYSHYRINGNFDKVVSNITRIATAKKMLNIDTPKIVAKTIMFKHLMNEMQYICELSKTAGADQSINSFATVYEANGIKPEDWIPTDQRYSRYDVNKLYNKGKLQPYKNNFEEEQFCAGILGTIPPVIDFKGNVFPCCHLPMTKEYIMGNIAERSFNEIWLSEKYIKFRMNVLKNRLTSKSCKRCYRPTNKY